MSQDISTTGDSPEELCERIISDAEEASTRLTDRLNDLKARSVYIALPAADWNKVRSVTILAKGLANPEAITDSEVRLETARVVLTLTDELHTAVFAALTESEAR